MTQRLHKYTFVMTVFTTDGNSSPDAYMAAVEKAAEGLTGAGSFKGLTLVELTDPHRATSPESRDLVDVPPEPVWPVGGWCQKGTPPSREELAYWEARDLRNDAITQAIYAWQRKMLWNRPEGTL